MSKTYTVDQIRRLVSSNKNWAERAVVALYDYQTQDEKVSGDTKHDNGVGFNGADAKALSYMARWIKSGRHLDGKYLDRAFRSLPKYAGQLKQIADEKSIDGRKITTLPNGDKVWMAGNTEYTVSKGRIYTREFCPECQTFRCPDNCCCGC